MDVPQNFRSAFNGFNREDVVKYISFISAKHETQVNELRAEAEELREQLNRMENEAGELQSLREELEVAEDEAAHCNSRMEHIQQERDSLKALMEKRDEELEQLKNQLAAQAEELAELRSALCAAQAAPAKKTDSAGRWAEELNAYRRAESCERRARERVNQMYDKANGALAEASVRVEQTAGHVSTLANQVQTDVEQLLKALTEGENALADTAVVLGAIRPEED